MFLTIGHYPDPPPASTDCQPIVSRTDGLLGTVTSYITAPTSASPVAESAGRAADSEWQNKDTNMPLFMLDTDKTAEQLMA
jgi:hypothetical protein